MEIILILFPIILYLYLFFIHYKKIIEVYDASFIEKETFIKRNLRLLIKNMDIISRDYEDYPEIKKYGRDVVNKLRDEPIYVLSISNKEYIGKKCPKNWDEQVRDVPYTGRPRNFDNTLAELQKSLGVEIYYVKVENSPEIRRLAKKLLPDLKMFGLHEPDSTYLAFTQFTKSTMITSDGALNKCCLQAQCAKSIEFQEFIDKIMQPSPITIVLRERRNYYKNRKHPH